jgi:hypothetical protein
MEIGLACGAEQTLMVMNQGVLCKSLKLILNNGWQQYLRECEAAAACNAVATDSNVNDFSQQTGTNLNESDSDFDMVTDKDEIDGYEIEVNSAIEYVFSLPLVENSDNDLWFDKRERDQGTNPTEGDTDGDGTSDHLEGLVSRDPTFKDKRVTVTIDTITAVTVDDEGLDDNRIEPRMNFYIDVGNGTGYGFRLSATGNNVDTNGTINPTENGVLFILVIRNGGPTVSVKIAAFEDDSGSTANEPAVDMFKSYDYSTVSESQTVNSVFARGDGTMSTVLKVKVE